MPFQWKVEPLQLLLDMGYTSYRLRKEKLFSETTIQKFRKKQLVSIPELDKLCTVTNKPIEALIVHVKPNKKTDA